MSSLYCFGDNFTFVLPDVDDDLPRELSANTKFQAARSFISAGERDWGPVAHLEHERDSTDRWMTILTKVGTSPFDAGLETCSLETGSKSPADYSTVHPIQWTEQLITFKKSMQPPAVMLMGDIKRWRRLQAYLFSFGSKNSTVQDTLLCLEDVLAHDDCDLIMGSATDVDRISKRYETARDQVIQATAVEKMGDQELDEILAVLYLFVGVDSSHSS